MNFCITPILGFVMLATTFFQSIAKPIPSIVITFMRQILFLIPFIYVFPAIWDINGIFIAQPASDALALILSAFLVVREQRQLYKADGASVVKARAAHGFAKRDAHNSRRGEQTIRGKT